MRKAALSVLLALSLAACKSSKIEVRPTVEEASRMASAIQMRDAKTAAQLVSGFHSVEDNAWRWTQREFTLALGTPPGAARNGAVLKLELTVPPVTIGRLKTVTLTAAVGGSDLAPETYAQPGRYTYQREVAANHLTGDTVRVNFRLDKAIEPGGGDIRELGIIVVSAALDAK